MSSQRPFWLVQLAVWGGFALLNMALRGYFVHYRVGELINSLTLCGSLLLASAFLRKYFQYRNTESLPRAMGHAVLGSLMAGVIALGFTALIILPNHQAIFGFTDEHAYLQTLFSFPFVFILLLCWSTIYLLVRRQKALKQAYIREKELSEQLANSRMDLLLNQLNPHFMFNAINNIRALILEDSDKARESLAQLSDVLRVTLQTKQDKLWSLQQEIALTKSFITLNELQFEDRLRVEWQIEGGIEKWQVPCLILQLLVENAIKHGIGKNSEGGLIEIAILASDHLQLTVTNPGQIQVTNDSTSLGITNIQQRLNLLFGDKGAFLLKQQADKVIATVELEAHPCIAP